MQPNYLCLDGFPGEFEQLHRKSCLMQLCPAQAGISRVLVLPGAVCAFTGCQQQWCNELTAGGKPPGEFSLL